MNMKYKKILVAEDDEISYALIKSIFTESGVEVLWAENGLDAIRLFKENLDVDVVMMDMKMPIMNGITAAKEIKKIHPNIPIIGVSSFNNHIMKNSDESLDAYVQKPFLPNQLVDVVEKQIETHVMKLCDELLKREEKRVKEWIDNEKEALHVLSNLAKLLELTDHVNHAESLKVIAKLDEIKKILNDKIKD